MNEEALIQKYSRWIFKNVQAYCLGFRKWVDHYLKEDLYNEACLAFLSACRAMELDSYDLNAYQYGVCRNKIRSALRCYIWRHYNMGGDNKTQIDFGRSNLWSGYMAFLNESANEKFKFEDMDDSVQLMYVDDHSHVVIDDFARRLNKLDAEIVALICEGDNYAQISNKLKIPYRRVFRRINIIRTQLSTYMNAQRNAC